MGMCGWIFRLDFCHKCVTKSLKIQRGFVMLSVRLSEEMKTRLEKLAKRTERGKSFYVREAMKIAFDILEKFPTEDDRRRHPEALAKSMLEWLEGESPIFVNKLSRKQRLVLMLRLARDSCKLTIDQAAARIDIKKTLLVEVESGKGLALPERDMKDWIIKLLGEEKSGNNVAQDDTDIREGNLSRLHPEKEASCTENVQTPIRRIVAPETPKRVQRILRRDDSTK